MVVIQRLDDLLYVNYMVIGTSLPVPDVVVVHTTCVEGNGNIQKHPVT